MIMLSWLGVINGFKWLLIPVIGMGNWSLMVDKSPVALKNGWSAWTLVVVDNQQEPTRMTPGRGRGIAIGNADGV